MIHSIIKLVWHIYAAEIISIQHFFDKTISRIGVIIKMENSHTFVEIDHETVSTAILLPSAESFKKGCCQ